jgi:hypothetical protein
MESNTEPDHLLHLQFMLACSHRARKENIIKERQTIHTNVISTAIIKAAIGTRTVIDGPLGL